MSRTEISFQRIRIYLADDLPPVFREHHQGGTVFRCDEFIPGTSHNVVVAAEMLEGEKIQNAIEHFREVQRSVKEAK